jgi:hypothetical protein
MNVSNIKGSLLESLVRRLLANCGFISVSPDNLYTYESNGLFYVNGRGAAHDADVLMEPLVQMPFSYPSRVLFECKAYDSKTSLPVVRNALGLKIDLNEFEIVTKDSLEKRKTNRRSAYAIEQRKRYNYQVGVASVGDFSKPAIEFAANNRIFLLSLSWFLDQPIINTFHSIDQQYVDGMGEEIAKRIYDFLKDSARDADYAERNRLARTYLERDTKVGRIITAFNEIIDRLFVGIIESGDLIFLFAQNENAASRLLNSGTTARLKGQIHYSPNRPDLWILTVAPDYLNQVTEFHFFVPDMIMDLWGEYNLDREKAVEIKGEFFSKIFVFNRGIRPDLPFFIINIDREWLNQVREREANLV